MPTGDDGQKPQTPPALARSRSPDADASANRTTRGCAAILCGLFLAALILPTTRAYPNGLVADDAYFYLQIGYNLGHSFFSSFDGIHLTSGYHLLWGGILGLLAMLLSPFSASKDWFMFAALATASGLAAYTAATYFRRTWERVFVFVFLMWSCCMTETLLLTALLLYLFDRALHHRQEFLTSPADLIVVVLIPLTRVDAAVVVAVLGAGILVVDRRKFGALAAALLVGLALQFATMKILFGDFFSVSSRILWSRSPGLNPDRLWRHLAENVSVTPVHVVSCLSVVFLFVYVVRAMSSVRERDIRCVTASAILACGAFVVPHLFFSAMREWYWTAPVILLFYVASCLGRAGTAPTASTVLQYYSIAACFVIAVELAGLNTKYSTDQSYTRHFVDVVNRTVPRSESLFQEDAAGFVGFWSEPHVINGDGMVNSDVYMRRMLANDLANYLEEEHVCFIIRDWPLEDDRIVAIGGLSVPVSDAYLLMSPPRDAEASLATQLKLYLSKAPRCSRFAYLANASL